MLYLTAEKKQYRLTGLIFYYLRVFLNTHMQNVCCQKLLCLVLCCVTCYSLLFSCFSSVFQLIIQSLFQLADCSASLFVFRGTLLVVLHVSFPEEAVSVFRQQRFHIGGGVVPGKYLIWHVLKTDKNGPRDLYLT